MATANWVSRTQGAAQFYGTQVQASTWKASASSAQAETNYAAGVQQAVTNKSRLAGVNASSDAVWQAGVTVVGINRYSDGVAHSQNRMAAAMGKLIPAEVTIIASLPARGIAGSTANMTRMTNFATQLHAQKGNFKARGIARA